MSYFGTVRDGRTGLPMADILVTDGRNIAKTDNNGCYCLEGWARARLIYAQVLTGKHDDWYQSIEPGRERYDFTLYPAEKPGTHRFLHLSDTEIFDMTDDECAPWLDFVRERGRGAAFLVHGGDICGDNGLPRHYRLMNGETVGFPVRYCIGNHDFRGEDFGESVYEQYYGPTWYAFDCGNVHYVVTSIGWGDCPSGYDPQDQWQWLAEDLRHKDPQKGLVLFSHGCCMSRFLREEDRQKEFFIDTQGREAWLRENGLLAVVFGHLHLHYHGLCDGLHYICTGNPKMGGIDASPAGMRSVQIGADLELTSQVRYCDDRRYQLPQAAWSVQLPGDVIHCDPVVYEDSLLVGTAQDGWPKNCGIARLDSQGRSLWFYPTKNSIKNNLTVDAGRVYAQDVGGNVYTLDANTGAALWITQTPLSTSRFDGSTGAALYRGKVFAGNSRQLSALDANTGRILWTCREYTAGENTAIRPVFWKNLLIFGGNWSQLYALDADTGDQVWHTADRRCKFLYATPLVDGDRLIVPSNKCLTVLDPADGTVVQAVQMPDHCLDSSACPVRDGDVLYISTVTDGVLALNAQTFEVEAHYPAGTCLTYSSGYSMKDDASVDGQVLADGEYLRFAGSDGLLYTCQKQGGPVRRQTIGAPALTAPVFFAGGIAVADLTGRVSLFLQ